jgi:hypothetical protein
MPPELIADYWRFRRLVSYCIGAYVIVKLRILLRFFYIKRTGRAKHGEVPYAICAYCMEKLFQNMYLETRLR